MMEFVFAVTDAANSSLHLAWRANGRLFCSLATDELSASCRYRGCQSAKPKVVPSPQRGAIHWDERATAGRMSVQWDALIQKQGRPHGKKIHRFSDSEIGRTMSPAINELFIVRTRRFRLSVARNIKVCRRGRQLERSIERRKIGRSGRANRDCRWQWSVVGLIVAARQFLGGLDCRVGWRSSGA